jgi:hypothetical protein
MVHVQWQCYLKSKKRRIQTPFYSRVVPHPSTRKAQRSLTSEIGRDLVHYTWYGRIRSIVMIPNRGPQKIVRKKLPPKTSHICAHHSMSCVTCKCCCELVWVCRDLRLALIRGAKCSRGSVNSAELKPTQGRYVSEVYVYIGDFYFSPRQGGAPLESVWC